MTVSYTRQVASNSWIGCFLGLLFRWRGSIYKLIWLDVFCYLLLYYTINLIYRFVLDEEQKAIFHRVAAYCNTFGNLIPVSFVLGFYVSLVATRWWNQYTSIPFPDNLALLVSAGIKRQDEKSKILMRTIVRYTCFCFAYTLTMISPRIKRKYPTMHAFVEDGLLLKDEEKIIKDLSDNYPSYLKYWLPLAWAANLVTRARHEGFIQNDPAVVAILNEINNFRTKCQNLLDYDFISVPLVYTQVVTLAVYSYFVVTLLGRQWTEARAAEYTELYFPILTVLEYFFYVGWLKVAEVLINPFGDDDEDFEVSWLVYRHIQVSYLIVDKMHNEHPKLMKDQYWNQVIPQTPKMGKHEKIPEPSTANIKGLEKGFFGDSSMTNKDGQSFQKSDSLLKRALRNSSKKKKKPNITDLENVSTDEVEKPEIGSNFEPESSSSPPMKDEVDFNRLKEVRQNLMRLKVVNKIQAIHDEQELRKSFTDT